MSCILVDCAICGSLELTESDITLVLSARPFYEFTCPGCGALTRRHADQRVRDVLEAVGCRRRDERPFTGADFDRAQRILLLAETPADLFRGVWS